MNLGKSYLNGWRGYVDFDGRSSRTDFWSFIIINIVAKILIVLMLAFMGYVGSLYLLDIFWLGILLLPTLAVGIRRMHDINMSGWWFGIIFLLPGLNRLLQTILLGMASPQTYAVMSLITSIILFWIPLAIVITLCCFKSKLALDREETSVA
ncbi:DUF805 domain-containing protein [Yersinia hibernica]|uniref:DUF805 domain-containing protein n=1 Tax=Yersinia hibernica TaxID=2339259 RepID=A0ABX5QY73_9GAMM|nr:DUF805 domain-containing protein [Yersinia hibernica]QAX78281.1 DUF805 domain-containing protein [Yersinia hibernica]